MVISVVEQLRALQSLASEIETAKQNAEHHFLEHVEWQNQLEECSARFEKLWQEFLDRNGLERSDQYKPSKNSDSHPELAQERLSEEVAEGRLDSAARKQNALDAAELNARDAIARDGRG